MTHLRIIQSTGATEEVSSSVILKLYELASSGDLDNTSVLLGRVNASVVKDIHLNYFMPQSGPKPYQDFYITATNVAISFADPEVERVLIANNIGSNGMITSALAASVTSVGNMFKLNTVITTLNDLSLFTNLTNLDTTSGFLQCTSLTTVNLPNITNISANNMFLDCTGLLTVNLPNVTNINMQAFRGCSSLTSVNIPSVTELKESLFYGCSLLSTINISNVSKINNSVFRSCSSLTSIDLSDVTTMGQSVFSGCTGLTSVTFSSGLTTIPNNCFLNCSALTSIDISNVTSIGTSAFEGCTQLATVTGLNSTVTSIPSNCFNGCTSLTSIDLSNITTIRAKAFYGCTSLTHVDLSNVTTFEQEVFRECTNLGSGETIEITHTGTYMPYGILYGAKYIGLILHIPNVTSWDNRYPLQHGLSSLQYFDASDCKITSIGSWYGTGGSVITYIVPSSVTSMDYRFVEDLSHLLNLIMLPETPPTIDDTSKMLNYYIRNNGRDAIVYVKDSTVRDLYLADSNWGSISNASTRIKTLAELPVGIWKTGLYQLYEPYLSNSSDPAYSTT